MLAIGPVSGVVVAAVCCGPADLMRARAAHPAAAVLAVVPDEAAEARLLAAGADEVVHAGAAPALVAARAMALAARRRERLLSAGAVAIDLLARTASVNGRPLDLREREWALLVALLRRDGAAVDHGTLRHEVCGMAFDPGTNLLAVHVSRLRPALQPDATITAVRGHGYRLDCRSG